MNVVCLAGRMTEPELKYTNSGTQILNFAVVVDKFVKGEKQPQFFNCVMMGERAEKVYPHLSKGMPVGVNGSLNQNKWEQDGKKRERIEVFVYNITFMGSKAKDEFEDDVPF